MEVSFLSIAKNLLLILTPMVFIGTTLLTSSRLRPKA